MGDLTKKDRRALWYAVDLAKYMVRACEEDPEIAQATKDHERARYQEARQALRKLYAAARQQQEGGGDADRN